MGLPEFEDILEKQRTLQAHFFEDKWVFGTCEDTDLK